MDAPRYCYRHPDRETGLSCSECGRPICYECMTPAPVGIRCPEHSGKPQGMQKVTRAAERAVTGVGGRRVNAVTLGLIGANVLVALIELAGGSRSGFLNSTIFEKGSLFATGFVSASGKQLGVAHGEWWRLFTAMFLHASFFHLLVNMYSLYFVGSIMESLIGRWRFLLLYLASGLAGSAGALLLSPLKPTVGASGAIFGVLGGLFVLERRGNIATGGQIAGLILINLVITFAFSSSISVGGHIGGLIGGMVLMVALLQFRRSALYSVAAVAGVVVISVVVAYAKVRTYQ
ncbi:MAG: rhomboid family intramembrane serine protease [Thermoleophilia bacterium]|nr:rhomboid family intramembrane serine protease [Thermoleophilia bacterium]